MEQTMGLREDIFKGIDKLNQEIIKLKDNLSEILDYIDLRRKETDEQTTQQQKQVETLSKEVEELERILEEKRKELSESRQLQEKYLGFANNLSLMEKSVLDEYNQVLNNISKNISPSLNLELISPLYKKKLIDEYLSKEKLSFKLIGNVLKIDNSGLEEIYDEKGTLACVFYKSSHGSLILSSDVFMKYLSDSVKEMNSLYFDYCKAATEKDQLISQLPSSEPSPLTEEERAQRVEEARTRYLNLINQDKEQLLKLLKGLETKEVLPSNYTNYAFENSTSEILNENTLTDLQNQLKLDFDQFFAKDQGLSRIKELVEKYQQYREGLGEERYLDFLLQQLGYPGTGQT
jgi:hypothetical protein